MNASSDEAPGSFLRACSRSMRSASSATERRLARPTVIASCGKAQTGAGPSTACSSERTRSGGRGSVDAGSNRNAAAGGTGRATCRRGLACTAAAIRYLPSQKVQAAAASWPCGITLRLRRPPPRTPRIPRSDAFPSATPSPRRERGLRVRFPTSARPAGMPDGCAAGRGSSGAAWPSGSARCRCGCRARCRPTPDRAPPPSPGRWRTPPLPARTP